MNLKRNSRIVRWAYFTADNIPYQTSLCPLFWRIVLLTPMKIIVTSACVGAVLRGIGIIGYQAITHLNITFPVIGAILFISYLVHISRLSVQSYEEPRPSLVIEYIKAKKRKICPIVDLTEN